MSDTYVDPGISSSGGWWPQHRPVMPRNITVTWGVDGAERGRRAVHRNVMREYELLEMVGRTYPAWLNVVSVMVLLLLPIGLVCILFDYRLVGLAFLGAGFLGVWIFGDLAARLGRTKYRTKKIGGTGSIS